jgi:hypothetical protein
VCRGHFLSSFPCPWATTKHENRKPVKVVSLWNYESDK